jgi:hypothetical protein
VATLCNRDEQRHATKWLPGRTTLFPESKSCSQVLENRVYPRDENKTTLTANLNTTAATTTTTNTTTTTTTTTTLPSLLLQMMMMMMIPPSLLLLLQPSPPTTKRKYILCF